MVTWLHWKCAAITFNKLILFLGYWKLILDDCWVFLWHLRLVFVPNESNPESKSLYSAKTEIHDVNVRSLSMTREDIARGSVGPTFLQLKKTQRVSLARLWMPQLSRSHYVPRCIWLADDLEAVTSPAARQVKAGLFWQDFPVDCYSCEQFFYDTNDTGSICPQLEPAHTTHAWALWKDGKYLLSQSGLCAAEIYFLIFKDNLPTKGLVNNCFVHRYLMTLHPVGLRAIWHVRSECPSGWLSSQIQDLHELVRVCVFTVLFTKPHHLLHNKVTKAGSQAHPLFLQIQWDP